MFCTTCKTEQPEDNFFWRNKTQGKRYNRCKPCTYVERRAYYARKGDAQSDRVRARVRTLRRKLYEYLLKNPCVRCGFSNPLALEFHHVGLKYKDVGKMVQDGNSWERIEQEITQCEVLCANCHKLETASTYGWYSDIMDG